MGDLLGSLNPASLGATGLLVVVVLMVLGGKLITKSQLDNERANTQMWRESDERKDEVIRVQGEALTELLMLARTTDHALRTIQAMGSAAFAAQSMGEKGA